MNQLFLPVTIYDVSNTMGQMIQNVVAGLTYVLPYSAKALSGPFTTQLYKQQVAFL